MISYTPYSEAYPPGYEDMQRRVPDTSKLQKQLSWKPEHDLSSIIDDVARDKKVSN
jgi:UDP-glucose 4-epimerase